MKYEYLCGHESDFFTMPANIIAVVRLDYCVQGLTEFSQIVECGKPVLAMRCIIAEPKRWTKADQDAGVLPEVGAKLLHIDKGVCEFVGVGSYTGNLAIKLESGVVWLVGRGQCTPIETPEEKAARLRDDWCYTAAKQLKNLEYSSTLTSIYDALLSGELTMPSKDGE